MRHIDASTDDVQVHGSYDVGEERAERGNIHIDGDLLSNAQHLIEFLHKVEPPACSPLCKAAYGISHLRDSVSTISTQALWCRSMAGRSLNQHLQLWQPFGWQKRSQHNVENGSCLAYLRISGSPTLCPTGRKCEGSRPAVLGRRHANMRVPIREALAALPQVAQGRHQAQCTTGYCVGMVYAHDRPLQVRCRSEEAS